MGFYAASKHALEGYVESLDHEVRTLGVRALLVQPGFMKTNIDRNTSYAAHPIDAYASARDRARSNIGRSVHGGEDPAIVAAAILEALNAPHPRLRYPVGKGASALSALRRLMPAALFDRSVRKKFHLDP